jgi:DNA-binding winged helix-turn-helix (wHTH) protein
MQQVRRIRFGPYVVDLRACELRKNGIRLRIRQQPIEILLMLLEKPGEVVLREEIRLRLWQDDTIVEFEHSINAAVQKLRDVLGESASSPRYIETVPRRGYRFLGTVGRWPGSSGRLLSGGVTAS